MTAKEELEAVKAIAEMMEALTEGTKLVGKLLVDLDDMAAQPAKLFEVMAKIAEMSEDEMALVAIVSTISLAKLRIKTRGTPLYDEIRTILNGKPVPAAAES